MYNVVRMHPSAGLVRRDGGFAFVALWLVATSDALHPGFGWMVSLGFVGGPGQALALATDKFARRRADAPSYGPGIREREPPVPDMTRVVASRANGGGNRRAQDARLT